MARERQVTRTIEYTVATTMCLNTDKAEVTTDKLTLTGTFDNEADIMKALLKTYATDSYKPVKILEIGVSEVLMGMSELDFIKYAHIIPPRN